MPDINQNSSAHQTLSHLSIPTDELVAAELRIVVELTQRLDGTSLTAVRAAARAADVDAVVTLLARAAPDAAAVLRRHGVAAAPVDRSTGGVTSRHPTGGSS